MQSPRGLVRRTSRRDNARMRHLPLALLAASISLLASCASQDVVERFDCVQPGMSRDEVVELLGEPSSSWTLTTARDGFEGERLQWGDGLSSLASSAAFDGDPDRAYSVVLDQSGRVVRAVAPRWVESDRFERDLLRQRRERRVGDW